MPNTFTTNYNFGKPETGSSRNQWGVVLNNTIDLVDNQIKLTETNANGRLKLDGTTPMTGSITFSADGTGLVFSRNTKEFDSFDTTNNVATHYMDVAGNRLKIRTENGQDDLLSLTDQGITYRGKDVLYKGNGEYVSVTGGVFTGPIKAPTYYIDDDSYITFAGGNLTLQAGKIDSMILNRASHIWSWYSNGASVMTLNSAGVLTTTGDVGETSDGRVKMDIETVTDGLAIVEALRPVTYTRTDTGLPGLGFIAQEVEQVVAQAVIDGEDGLKKLSYTKIIAPLVSAVQELSAKVKELEAKLNG